MSQSIKNITIAFVPNDKAVIALMLEYLQLCKVRKICVMPDFRRNQLCYTAFLEVSEWFDSEAAYNMIKRIRNPLKEARIVHSDDDWWAVEETDEADLQFTQGEAFLKWTMEFHKAPIKDEVEKHVVFKRGLAIEESIFIDDLDLRMAKSPDTFDFEAFCTDFGLAHGFDFEAEYKEWSNTQKFPEYSEEQIEKIRLLDEKLTAEYEMYLKTGVAVAVAVADAVAVTVTVADTVAVA
jgi:hypothetical protein